MLLAPRRLNWGLIFDAIKLLSILTATKVAIAFGCMKSANYAHSGFESLQRLSMTSSSKTCLVT
jgi:hypothetical protein